MNKAQDFFRQGDLDGALKAVSEELRKEPGNAQKRAFFTELLCLAGDWERADRQLETLLSLDDSLALTVGVWRQLIRAAQAREDVFVNGAAPELTQQANPMIAKLLEMQLCIRNQAWADAALLAEQVETLRPACPGAVNGQPVDDMRDLDDCLNGILEVLATNGRYFWVALDQVESITIEAPQRPLDLLWRKARMLLRGGTDGEVFLPAIYPLASDNPAHRLGRGTDWVEQDGLVRGQGHRTWLAGDEALLWQDIDELTPAFETAAA